MVHAKWINLLIVATILLTNYLLHANNPPPSISVHNNIPIILSADNHYAPYMYVTLFSILENAHKNTSYNFYLFVSENFDNSFLRKILELKKRFTCDIHFIKISPQAIDCSFEETSNAIYYRLLAAELLPQYKKCIYLDTDTIVLDDLTNLYNIELEDNYVAGVKDFPSITTYKVFQLQAIDKFIDLLDFSKYINSGVLVMNLELMREHKITEKFKTLIKHGVDNKRTFPYHDQDIINIVCRGHIKCIDMKYNFMSNFVDILEKQVSNHEYTLQDFNQFIQNPVIIHYAMEKPWEKQYNSFAQKWWEYAHKTSLFSKSILTPNVLGKF